MQSGSISWPLLYSALALTLIVVGLWYFWDRLTALARRRTVVVPSLPPDTDPLLTPESTSRGRTLPSILFLVAVGTMGARQVVAALLAFAAAKLSDLVGAVLIIEHDAGLREQLQAELAAVYSGRVWFAHSEDYAGGFANKPVSWVLDHANEWGVPIHSATEAAIDGFFRRSEGRAPAMVFTFTSLGGQAPAGVVALAQLSERFGDGETTLFVAATALPRHDRLRWRWVEIKSSYERYGIAGWVLVDNLEDATSADYSVVATLVGHMAAGYSSPDVPTALNNVLALALTERPGSVLVTEIVATKVVAFPLAGTTATGARYYVHRRPLVVQVQRSLRRLAAGRGLWSATLPVTEAGTSTFDLVVLPLVPDALTAVRDDVLAGEALRHTLTSAASAFMPVANQELTFAALPARVDPDRPTCQVLCVRLTAVRDGAALVPEIVKQPVDRQFLQTEATIRLTRRNGHGAVSGKDGM